MCYNNYFNEHIFNFLELVAVTLPGQLVSTPGGSAQFVCLVFRDGLREVHWLVNGTQLDSLNLKNVSVQIVNPTIETLTFSSLSSEFNMTRIACRAVFNNGNVDSESTLLLLQG